MRQDNRYLIFILGWLCSLLFLLLLSQSYLSYLVSGVMSLFLLLYSRRIQWSKLHHYRLVAVSWFCFLVFFGLAAISTISWPLTFDATSSWLMVFVVFWFVVLHEKLIFPQLIISTLLLLGIVATIISVGFFLIPSWAEMLPGMNLLHATYGHNHLAALLLLVIPLSWWWALDKNSNSSHNYGRLALTVIFSLSLLLSFGRTAVSIGFLQLIFLILIFFQHKKPLDSLIKKVLLILVSLFLLTFATQIFFSITPIIKDNFFCPTPLFKKQLCKSLGTEVRLWYWHQAFMVAKEFPLLGAGPGTFGITSKKYQIMPLEATSYAHNAYLQMFAELGVIGGSGFLLLMGVLLIKVIHLAFKSDKKKLTWQKAIALSLIGIYLNVIFDFDWSFTGLLALTMILAALVIRSENFFPLILKRNDKIIELLFKATYYGALLLLISLAVIYLIIESFIANGKVGQAFNIFPYFHWHRKIYEMSPTILDQQKEKFFQIYQYHPDIYQSYISSISDQNIQQRLRENWLELQPGNRATQDVVSYYLEKAELEQAVVQINKTLAVWRQIEKSGFYKISYNKKIELTQQMLKLADLFYQANQPAETAKWYARARFEDEWILHKHPPIFLQHHLSPDQEIVFFVSLAEIPGEYFGQYREVYSQAFLNALVAVKSKDELLKFPHYAKWLAELTDWRSRDIWETLSQTALAQVQINLERNEYNQAFENLEAIFKVWQFLSDKSEFSLHFNPQLKTAQYLVEVGNHLAITEMPKTIQSYQLAQELVPWILNEEPQWFEVIDQNKISTVNLTVYIDATFDWSWEKIGWKTEERTQVFVTLIKKLISEQNYDRAFKYSLLTNQIPAIAYEPRMELIVYLQSVVQNLLENDLLEKAEVVTRIMEQILPREDWEHLFQ